MASLKSLWNIPGKRGHWKNEDWMIQPLLGADRQMRPPLKQTDGAPCRWPTPQAAERPINMFLRPAGAKRVKNDRAGVY
jgi:hypothetical protein